MVAQNTGLGFFSRMKPFHLDPKFRLVMWRGSVKPCQEQVPRSIDTCLSNDRIRIPKVIPFGPRHSTQAVLGHVFW